MNLTLHAGGTSRLRPLELKCPQKFPLKVPGATEIKTAACCMPEIESKGRGWLPRKAVRSTHELTTLPEWLASRSEVNSRRRQHYVVPFVFSLALRLQRWRRESIRSETSDHKLTSVLINASSST